MIGQRPDQTIQQTLPELNLAMRGWERAQGVDPDRKNTNQPMTKKRLQELLERIDGHG